MRSGSFIVTESFRPLHLAFLPAGTFDTASSRLRCFGLARELGRLGYKTQIGCQSGDRVDVLFIQKRIDERILALARAVKVAGGRVVYDIDDYGDALAWMNVSPETRATFVSLCDVLCVDTQMRLEVFAKDPIYAGIPQKWVVPDPVDYVGQAGADIAVKPANRTLKQGLVACWYGYAPNVIPAAPFLETASKTPGVARVHIISNHESLGKLKIMFPDYHIETWALNTFAGRLRDADFCLLIHDSSLEGVQKSNNKMLASLALGVVPFVSRTPAYESTARDMGLEALIIDQAEDLPARLTDANLAAARAAITTNLCQDTLKRFLPDTVARDFSDRLQVWLGPRASVDLGHQARKLTIATDFRNEEASVRQQLDFWRTFAPQLINQLEFILIDDFSNPPATLNLSGLPARLYRVDSDKGWNRAGCRNLASAQLRTDWVMFCNVNEFISPKDLGLLLGGLSSLEKDSLYKFTHLENGVPVQGDYDSFLAGRATLQSTGGYDEDFSGYVGSEHRYFLERWRRSGHRIMRMNDIALLEKKAHFPEEVKECSRNRTLMEEKLKSGTPRPKSTLRFSWHLVADFSASVSPAVRLNLGSGEQPLLGYINVDLAPERAGFQPDVNCDVRDLREVFPDGCADEILAVHVIEHFWRWEVVGILKEWVRVLKPGGDLILETPNLVSACQELLKDPVVGARSDRSRTMWCLYGDPKWKDPLMCHRWLYTPQSLAEIMHEAGLVRLRQEPAWFKLREPRDMRIVGTKPIDV